MDNNFSVSLTKVIKELQLDTAYMPGNPDDILITSRDVIRPGLELTGFLDYLIIPVLCLSEILKMLILINSALNRESM